MKRKLEPKSKLINNDMETVTINLRSSLDQIVKFPEPSLLLSQAVLMEVTSSTEEVRAFSSGKVGIADDNSWRIKSSSVQLTLAEPINVELAEFEKCDWEKKEITITRSLASELQTEAE